MLIDCWFAEAPTRIPSKKHFKFGVGCVPNVGDVLVVDGVSFACTLRLFRVQEPDLVVPMRLYFETTGR